MNGQYTVTAQDIIDALRDAEALNDWAHEAMSKPVEIDGVTHYLVDSQWKQQWLKAEFLEARASRSAGGCKPNV